jgi:hypothetical protein
MSTQPDQILESYAESGDTRVPIHISGSPAPEQFTIENGFPVITSLPVGSGGLNPARVDFNGVFLAITRVLRWLNIGGLFTWIDLTSSGGYPIGARVRKVGLPGCWINLVDNNTTNPDTGGANWGSDVVASGGSDDALWDLIPLYVPTPVNLSGLGVTLADWLTFHPKWQLSDGTNGTHNLINRFIIGALDENGTTVTGVATAFGGSKDAVVVAHAHAVSDPGHYHSAINYEAVAGNEYSAIAGANNLISATSGVTTGVTVDSAGVSGTNQRLPPYVALVYVERITL